MCVLLYVFVVLFLCSFVGLFALELLFLLMPLHALYILSSSSAASDVYKRHIFWGWMQVEEVLLAAQASEKYPWIDYHPHCQPKASSTDLLYLASVPATSNKRTNKSLGAGIFSSVTDNHVLSDPDRRQPSAWRLPYWFYPKDRTPLTFHANSERWKEAEGFCRLQSVARGQEFVLDAAQYPQALAWARQLIDGSE